MNTIARLTEDCERDDCKVVCHGSSMTCIGWTQSYDKRGNPIDRDPNTTETRYECVRCGKVWNICETAGVETIFPSNPRSGRI